MNLTPLSQMNTEAFARKMTGGENLNVEQKKQIREQQEVMHLAMRESHIEGFLGCTYSCLKTTYQNWCLFINCRDEKQS